MDKEDARKQTLEQLHERRKQVVRLHNKGHKVMKIVEMTGLTYPTVRSAIDLFVQGGWPAIRPTPRGRAKGEGRLLTREQENQIQRAIIDKRPEQLKMDFCLWSRAAVMQLIEQEYGIKLPVRTVGKYLKRWGFTPQKPIKKAYEQRPEAVKAWLDEHYPAIAAKANAESGEIHWGDETALTNTDVRGRSYAPSGQTPVTYAPGGKREKLSMIATVTNQGKARWMIIDEAFNADKLIEFLKALIKDTGKKVFLIVDNLRVHHAKPVKAWLQEHKAEIEMFYLPSYSPELNPEERLNADLKQAIGKKVPVRTKARLREAANEHMAQLALSPDRIKSFFQDQPVKYAA
jgi:transposase